MALALKPLEGLSSTPELRAAAAAALGLEMDPTSPRAHLASRHPPSIELLKIVQRQQRECSEHPSLHSFAPQCLGILADRAGWADVAMLLSQGALEDGEGSACPRPPCNQGLPDPD